MSPREKQAPLKAAFVFLGPLTSVPSASAGGTFFFPDTSKKRLGHK
jgi:hypothetical protein